MSIITPPSSWASSLSKAINNGDGILSLCSPSTPYYLIVPLFCINAKIEILNKNFGDGYSIVKSEDFHQKYLDNIYDPNGLLHADVRLPRSGAVINRPEARYVLIKKVNFCGEFFKNNDETGNKIINQEIEQLNLLITAMRLFKSGAIHINRAYFVSDAFIYNLTTKISTTLYDINTFYYVGKEYYFIEEYQFDDETINGFLEIFNLLKRVYNKFWLPLSYFNQYNSSYDIVDKLVKLSIIWESTILNGRNEGLKYILGIRASSLLQKNVSDILKIAYDVRSNIVHTGNIPSSLIKKIKKIIENDLNDFGTLFNFIKVHLEPITRGILNKFLIELSKSEKDLEEIATEIDINILNKLECL